MEMNEVQLERLYYVKGEVINMIEVHNHNSAYVGDFNMKWLLGFTLIIFTITDWTLRRAAGNA